MTPTATREVTAIPRITHEETMRITEVENRKFAQALRSLEPPDWAKPTDCPLWDVRALVSHVVGSSPAQASPREFVRQVRKGRPLVAEIGARYWWDGMNQVQVREREMLTAEQLIAEWDICSKRALRARSKIPRLIARLPL